MTLRVLALTRYGSLGASSRMRFLQYLPALAVADIQVQAHALFDDATLAARYRRGRYTLVGVLRCFASRVAALCRRRHFDLLWIEKEALPWWPLWVELALLRGVPYVLDYDDAVFHNYDQHRFSIVRQIFGRRLDGLMARAALVVVGNDYLAQRARAAGARKVEIVSTVIDLNRYPDRQAMPIAKNASVPVVVWIGSPSTLRYLELLHMPLKQLAMQHSFVLRVIGGEITLPGVAVECIPWSEDTEVAQIASADIGVMPLLDSPWEQGKCGYKLIQYMACGLPVVASPVGVNRQIVDAGVNGYLAADEQAWRESLARLLEDAELRRKMGAVGRQSVEQKYCLQVTQVQLSTHLHTLAFQDRACPGSKAIYGG